MTKNLTVCVSRDYWTNFHCLFPTTLNLKCDLAHILWPLAWTLFSYTVPIYKQLELSL